MGEPELLGIAHQGDPVSRHLAELFEAIQESGLLDLEYRPRSVNRYQDLGAAVLARLGRNGGKRVPRILGRVPVEQLGLDVIRLNRDLA